MIDVGTQGKQTVYLLLLSSINEGREESVQHNRHCQRVNDFVCRGGCCTLEYWYNDILCFCLVWTFLLKRGRKYISVALLLLRKHSHTLVFKASSLGCCWRWQHRADTQNISTLWCCPHSKVHWVNFTQTEYNCTLRVFGPSLNGVKSTLMAESYFHS